MPVDLAGGVSITESGIRAVIKTELGIEITFDWSTVATVSLSSSYYGNVDGLCGNYNGNKEDELNTTAGTPYANVTDWAVSWSVTDGDPFCYHHCEGTCPQCSPEDQKRYVSVTPLNKLPGGIYYTTNCECDYRYKRDRSVYQPTQLTLANVAHLSVIHRGGHAHLRCQKRQIIKTACNGSSHSHLVV